MTTPVVLGVDAGGTSTRALVCDAAGRALGRGRSGGANVRSAVGDPAANLADAVRQALDAAASLDVGADRGPSAAGPRRDASALDARVEAVCVGIAGTEARREEVEALVARALAAAGVTVVPIVVTDLEIAYRSVALSSSGALLLAGTGAVAARFEDWSLRERRDGLGWLLGDRGSGVWIGRRVLRAVAADLDGGPTTAMTAGVLALLELPADAGGQELIRATDGLPAASWGQCAPIALAHAAHDRVAARIVDDAADALVESLRGVRPDVLPGAGADADPVVLAGGLLEAGPLREKLAARVAVAGYAHAPVVGACIVAAASLGVDLAGALVVG